MSNFYEIGQETKLAPELAHMAFVNEDVQPFSEKKADGSAVRYVKITPPADGTYSRGDTEYLERLSHEYYPLKPADFVSVEQGIGVVSYMREKFGYPIHVEKKFGLSGHWGWRTRSPWNDHLYESTGGIRPEARALYKKNFLYPFIGTYLAAMGVAIATEVFYSKWRPIRFLPAARSLGGLPGTVTLLAGVAWLRGKHAGAYEADFRRYEEAKNWKKNMEERKEANVDAWEEHKASKKGWWSTQ